MEAKKKPAKNDKTERNINDFAVGDRVRVNQVGSQTRRSKPSLIAPTIRG
jgi:hypothetical protein